MKREEHQLGKLYMCACKLVINKLLPKITWEYVLLLIHAYYIKKKKNCLRNVLLWEMVSFVLLLAVVCFKFCKTETCMCCNMGVTYTEYTWSFSCLHSAYTCTVGTSLFSFTFWLSFHCFKPDHVRCCAAFISIGVRHFAGRRFHSYFKHSTCSSGTQQGCSAPSRIKPLVY